MAELMISKNNVLAGELRESKVKTWGRRIVALGGVGIVASLFGVGSNLMFRNNNMDDFMALKAFTSPEHQDDRRKTQDAFDAQDKMRIFFAEKGGVTDQEAELMAGVVGLTPEEIKSLLDNKLYKMDYDGDVPEASSSEVTKGLTAVALGSGILVGAAGTGAYVALKRKQNNAELSTS